MTGNGLFLFRMARRRKDLNFLGLEINEKVVALCIYMYNYFSSLAILCFGVTRVLNLHLFSLYVVV